MLQITHENLLDLKYFASGVFYPLEGFMNYEEYKKVIYEMQLLNGEIWTLPITLEVDDFKDIYVGQKQDLYYQDKIIGNIQIEDKFCVQDQDLYEIFQTKDEKHPGIVKEKKRSSLRVGGKIELKEEFYKDSLYKNILKDVFNADINTIVGFQTRNPIHRAHEHLQRIALEICDALFINPLTGWKKQGDFTEAAVMSAYKTMFDEFYPKDRVYIQGLQTAMRYAGPKEAIFHALLRRNMGCTHFIIGRDHAGVGDYYGIYEAQKLAKDLSMRYDLGIDFLLLKEPYYCSKCQKIVSEKNCAHYKECRIAISGTQIRKDLSEGKIPSELMMRSEISASILALGRENIFID
ncbi:sulfate adenylyltransferase [Campylobacter jejuni]|nr:sulfate adenylyltransferase [Campylobacter jejuni]ECR3135498.1 sulfate adenylyltransferase [Campylobacter jejuni]EDP4662400.1 sulfate adenylyltransferase [Campylobacter jejuni]ELS1236757.1 sulfate adenylyltransferase [Campylobacter jejuni]MBX0819189.1 sulfate adenylyltransferase [Campylobacter jejuni]